MMINYYSSYKAVDENNFIPIRLAFEWIKSNKYKHHTDYLRQEKDKDKRQDYKKTNLPAVIFQGTFSHRANSDLLESSGFATLDFDNVKDTNDLKNKLSEDAFVYATFISPSGGLKAIIKIPKVKNDAEYKTIYIQLLEHYSKYSPTADEQTKDISRLCWLSHDKDIYIFEKAMDFPVEPDKNLELAKPKLDVNNLISGVNYGNRNETAFKLACRFNGKKMSREEALIFLLKWNESNKPPLPEKEINDCVESAYRYENKQYVENSVLTHLLKEDRRRATETLVNDFLKTNFIYTTRDDEHSEMWIYNNGIYIPDGKSYVAEFCRDILGDNYTTQICNEVIAKIEADTYIAQDDFFKVNYIEEIAVLNGILNILTKELMPFEPKKIFFNKIPVIYDPTKSCEIIKQHLKNVLSHEDDIPVIQELFGYLLYRDYKIEKAFMFTGSGRNGKGKTVELMKRFLGIDNCSNISLQQMEQDTFAIGELFNKMANLSPDINSEALKNTGYFKSLTGHDLQSAARKFKTRVNFTNYAKMVFCSNELPRTTDLNIAFFNRWILLDFPYTFLSQKEIDDLDDKDIKNVKLADTAIIDKLSTANEMSGLLNWALEGLNRLLKRGDFSYSKNTNEVKLDWIRKSDSINAFLIDYVEENYESEVTKSEFRYKYSHYCKIHKLRPVTDKIIKDTLTTKYGVSEIRHLNSDGNQIFYWVGIKFNEKVNNLLFSNGKDSKGSLDSRDL